MLKHLFTPEEAELACHLTLEREDASCIALRAGLSTDVTEQHLAEMAHKGLIFSIHPEQGSPLYHIVPLAVGIFEFQVKNLDDRLVKDLADYWSVRIPPVIVQTIPQVRTIPVGESIQPHLEALPYEQVEQLIKSHEKFAVAPCFCRIYARLRGGGCTAPDETCLMFGEWAEYYVRDNRARALTRTEVMEIIAMADKNNLVLQPSNVKDIAFMCCCGVLNNLKQHPRPAEIVASAFIATLNEEQCEACWTCLERCQMEALTPELDHAGLNKDRCIGCGLCVTTCPSVALTLIRRVDRDSTELYANITENWQAIIQSQNEAREVERAVSPS